MATLALPIRELEHSVCIEAEKARAQTECVAAYSGKVPASIGTALKVALKTLGLKWLLSGLVRSQDKLINAYIQQDFIHSRTEDLAELASSLDQIVSKERALLDRANTLGAEIRVWWGASLLKLSEQVEHLDSIAESLHLESSPEGSLLLAVAAEQFAMK